MERHPGEQMRGQTVEHFSLVEASGPPVQLLPGSLDESSDGSHHLHHV